MERVQHDQVKAGMHIKLPQGRWVEVGRVIKIRENTSRQAASALITAKYLGGRDAGKAVQIYLYERTDGYQLRPQGPASGRADVKDAALREYSIRFVAVDRVDNQGEACGYCQDLYSTITCNIYATVTTESGRAEESAWSTCESCVFYSIDQVEDVDPAYKIIIERSAS